MFQKATKKQARLRLALIGPAGSGKTFSALRIARGLGGRVALIDTERASASKYADRFAFETCALESFHPERYVEAIVQAEREGFDVLIIDSLSHAWSGKDGALELVDNAVKRSKLGNSFAAWREVTPIHNALVDAMLHSQCHVIATMRSKTEYVVETVNGKQVPRKVGLAPVQRDGIEYEFDVVGDLDESTLAVSKTRYPALVKAVIKEPGEALGETLKAWLTDDSPPVAAPAPTAPVFGPLVHFGPFKGRPVAQLSETELEATIEQASDHLASHSQSKYAPKLRSALTELEAERVRRQSRSGSGTSLELGLTS